MQVFATVLAGVLVFVLGQIAQRFFLEPIKELHAQRAKISYMLLRYQAKITNASNESEELQNELRELAARLLSTAGQVPFYSAVAPLFRLPSEQGLIEAAGQLNLIAYGTGPVGRAENPIANVESLRKVSQLLEIRTSYR